MLANAPIFASLPCVDMKGARKFYGETLGLKEVFMSGMPEEMAEQAAMFECGRGTMLLVYSRATPTTADHTAAGWMVEDIDATVDDLIGRGITFEVYDMPDTVFDERGVASDPSGQLKSAWFKDPEGNILAINQMP
jgi:catechol 2,3-dioxygenase-like lactoylglutathione lyase family enzyme